MYLRKISIFLIVSILGFCTQSQAQLTVTSAAGMTPQQLVQNTLVGTGVTVSNVEFNGSLGSISSSQIGSFATGSTPTNLGLTDGLILSSGGVNGAIGPNISISTTTAFTGTPITDPQLQALVILAVNDASVLEFDFIPLSDTIKFRYIFASDEYPEFVCSDFNDIFGFFISGMNPMGPNYINTNIAIIPGTTLPVTINALNTGVVGQFGNINDCTSLAYSSFYIDNTGGTFIEYDGFTVILTAWALVIPCTQYHMKLAVADCMDNSYDSGVFLEANSFSSPQVTIDTSFSTPTASIQNAIEGCNDISLTFRYPFNATLPVPITIESIEGTAINGVDYLLSPPTSNLYIPVGSDSVRLTISPIYDTITEGTETIKFIFKTTPCPGNIYDTIIFNIQNYDLLTATAYGDTVFCNDHTPLSVVAQDGTPPYQYFWSNGAGNTANVTPTMSATTLYNVTVTDACLKTANDSALVVIDCDFARAGNDTTICLGGTATLTASGGPVFSWSTGESTATINVSPTVTTTYIVTVTDVFSDNDTVTVFVNPLPAVTATATPSTICLSNSSMLQASGTQAYSWAANITDLSLNGQQTLENPVVFPTSTTIYTVTGTDSNACASTATVVVNISPQPTPKIVAYPNPVSVFDPVVRIYDEYGGSNNYSWFLGDGSTSTQSNFYHTYSDQDTGRYLVSVIASNAFGCSGIDSLWVIVRPDATFYIPNSFTPNNDGLNDVFKISGMGVQEFEMNVYDRWGKNIFSSKGVNEGWDGKINNVMAPQGTYSYIIIYKDNTGIRHSKSGVITIIR